MNTPTRKLGPVIQSILLALLAVTLLWPPGPYSPRAYAQEQPPSKPRVFVPQVTGGRGSGTPAPTPTPQPSPPTTVPDLRFTPDTVTLAPGGEATITVRVEPAADLRGASFELPGVQDGVSSSFEAAADGTSGTLTLAASAASEAAERTLQVQGRSGLDSSKTWVGALRITTTATLTAKTIFADAVNGKDTNAGTLAAPVKTLTKALTKVVAGDTVKLAAGTYDKTHSGDTFPLLVPSGVTVVGTLQANGAKGTFLAPESSAAGTAGLTFGGDAAVKDLELDVFGTALSASKGTLTVSNLNMIFNRFNVALSGTALATLTNASIVMSDGQTGVSVSGQAQLTMNGGKVEGTGGCGGGAIGVHLTNVARATLTGQVTIKDIGGRAVALDDTSTATISFSEIRRAYPDGCFPGFGAVDVRNSASLTLKSTTVRGNGGTNTIGITSTSDAPLTLNAATVTEFTGKGIDLLHAPINGSQLVLDRSTIVNNTLSIDARNEPNARIVINDSIVFGRSAAILASNIKIRESDIGGGLFGLLITGMQADLGTAGDPGHNTFQVDLNPNDPASASRTVLITDSNLPGLLVQAVGNTWNPNVQGADAQGQYVSGTQVTSTSLNAQGQNFKLSAGTGLQF